MQSVNEEGRPILLAQNQETIDDDNSNPVRWQILSLGRALFALTILIIGSVYLDECPAQPLIPIYLVVAGAFGILQQVFTVWTKCMPEDSESPRSMGRSSCIYIEYILETFLGIWFILGCVWVYGLYEPEYKNTEEDTYCNKTLYLFAFWIFNISFISLAVIIALAFCCCIINRLSQRG